MLMKVKNFASSLFIPKTEQKKDTKKNIAKIELLNYCMVAIWLHISTCSQIQFVCVYILLFLSVLNSFIL